MTYLALRYQSTDANVTLGPFAWAGSTGRMIAWLELFLVIVGFKYSPRPMAEDAMVTVICISVLALLVFLSLTGPADRSR